MTEKTVDEIDDEILTLLLKRDEAVAREDNMIETIQTPHHVQTFGENQ